jgi:5'-nucleotidase
MRILVTNDDGIHAPGLKTLEKIAKRLSDDVWVVAPDAEQSGASHSLTLTMPIRVREVNRRKFAVRGTPTDCVMMASTVLVKGKRPDLVLSGVNRGANLGEDTTYSGTIAAAMEGTLLGIRAVALSQTYTPGHPVKWATAEHHGPKVIKRLLTADWPDDVLMNVNFPDAVHGSVNGTKVVRQGRRNLFDLNIDQRIDARNVPYYWLGFKRQTGTPPAASDVGAVQAGFISVTPLHLDLTHVPTLKRMRDAFA